MKIQKRIFFGGGGGSRVRGGGRVRVDWNVELKLL